MAEASTIQIPKDVLQPIIDAHVSSAIAQALGNQSQLIAQAVAFALNSKVDSLGQPPRYEDRNNVTFLQWLVNDAIKKAATDAVRTYIAGDIDAIKAQVAKEIKNQRSPLTKQLVEGIARAAVDMSRYNIRVSVDGTNT